MHFCLSFHVKTSKPPSDYVIYPTLFFPMSVRECADIGVGPSSRWVQPAPLRLRLRPGEAKQRVRFPSGCACRVSCGAFASRAVSAASSEPRAPPTCDVIVRRGFSSADSSLGISFITMATALSAALEPFPYNSEINNGASQQRAWQQPTTASQKHTPQPSSH